MRNNYTKILITGATGFAGSEVLKYLSNYYNKENLFGSGRNLIKANKLQNLGFQMIIGDLSDSKFVEQNFSEITHIVHCAAKSEIWGSYNSFYSNNVIPIENLLKLKNLQHIIYISTPSIYFNFKDRYDIHESDKLPKSFVNNYSRTKYIGEELIINYDKTKIKKHIFRPRAIIGAGDKTLMPRLLRAYNAKRLKIIGSGNNIGDFTSVKNLAHAVYLALKKKEQTDQIVFNLTDDYPVKLWDFINKSLVKLGLEQIHKKAPYRIVYTFASINEFYNKLFSKKEPILTKYGVGILNYSLTMNIDAVKEQLDYKPIISSDESINEFVVLYNKKYK